MAAYGQPVQFVHQHLYFSKETDKLLFLYLIYNYKNIIIKVFIYNLNKYYIYKIIFLYRQFG